MSDALKGLLGAVVGALVTAGATAYAASLGYFNKDRELDIQMVNVGLSILRGEATGDKDSLQSRRFALRLLRKYADVDIPDEELQEWADKGTTPFKQTIVNSRITFERGKDWIPATLQLHSLTGRIEDAIDSLILQECIKNEDREFFIAEITETISKTEEIPTYNPIEKYNYKDQQYHLCTALWRFAIVEHNLSSFIKQR